MRKLVSIFVFFAALSLGVFVFPENTPTFYEKIYPSFSQEEINGLIGKRVVNKFTVKKATGLKYPLGMKYALDAKDSVMAEVGRNGETGQIVNLQEFMNVKDPQWQKMLEKCDILVKWDEKNERGRDMFSCHGRFSARLFLEIKK